ncbi:MAG: phosphodiester glycosidase family protein [Gemmatimonadota bacterium]|nr:phosphodiester glycosidase family protein [Gemmatimonadota bacterium]
MNIHMSPLLALLAFVATACGGKEPVGPPPDGTAAAVHSVIISPDTATLSLAGTRQLAAIVRDFSGNALTGRLVTWTSLDPRIARVSDEGMVTAVAAGTVKITASSESRSDTASIAVSPFLSGERTLVPGVIHRYVWDAAKPWAIHILEVNLRACGVDLRTAKANDNLIGRTRTTALAAQVQERLSRPVIAAINGDFFTPLGVPQGAQVADAEIIKTSATSPAFGLTFEKIPFIGVHALAGELRARSGPSQPIRQVNERPDAQSVALYNRFWGSSTPSDTGAVEVVVSLLPTTDGRRETVQGVVLQVDTTAAGVTIPPGGAVLAGRSQVGAFLRTNVTTGDTLTWTYRFRDAPGHVTEMIGGNFQLLRGGQDVTGGAADRERHPRTGIGLKPDGTVLMVTVDGRQPSYSVGMSQPEMIELFRQLGATELLNLDGGGSTTLVLYGQLANRPSEPSGERPVANALTVLGPAAGACK